MNLSIHIDGGARGNPGPAGIGVILKDQDTGKYVHEAGFYIGRATNNVAEYSALIRSLELAESYQAKSVMIHSDSELMVKQITGVYKVKSPDLKELYQHAQMLMLKFDTWQIKHVYREQNKRADQLVNMALDGKTDIQITPDTSSNSSGSVASAEQSAASRNGAAEAKITPSRTGEQYPKWTATVTSQPARQYPGGCEAGQVFTFGPSTPADMCVYAAQAMFAESPVTDLNGNGPKVTVRCPRCGAMIRVEMQN